MPNKLANFWTPEEKAEHQRLAKLAEQDREWASAEADQLDEQAMQEGAVPHLAKAILRRKCKRMGLSDDDLRARSGLGNAALETMAIPDADPSLSTLQAYAAAVGLRIRILFDDEHSPEAQKADRDEERRQTFLARKRQREAGS